MVDDLPDVQHPLTEQAEGIIDESTSAVDLCSELDFGLYERDDKLSDSGQAKPFAPMIAARFLQALQDYSDRELKRKLDDPDVAETLGFDSDEVPDRSTFQRARTGRFDQFDESIERAREQISRIAALRGSPIGYTLQPEDRGTSKRTLNRILREKTVEVLEEMKDVVFPALSLPRPEKAIYDEEELLQLESLAAISNSAANNGGVEFGDELDPDAEIDPEDPFHLDGPSGETLLESIKELSAEAITEMVNRAAHRTVTRAKPHEEFNRPVMLAIDITYVEPVIESIS